MDTPQPPRSPSSSGPPPQSPSLPQGTPVVRARSYPKPPPLLSRLIQLCFKPESWAETARYPLHVTLLPLLLAIVIGAVAIACGATSRLMTSINSFANSYEQLHTPPLQISSEGVLSVQGELANPIRFELPGVPVIIDPTGKTTPESVKTAALLITDRNLILLTGQASPPTLSIKNAGDYFGFKLPPAGRFKTIDGVTVQRFVSRQVPRLLGLAVVVAIAQIVGESVWAGIMMFLLSPLVMIAAAGPRSGSGPDLRLLIPRRAAYRMVAGILVPVVLMSAALNAAGHPVQAVLENFTFLFWFLATGGMAVWTGILARRMYGPRPKRR